MIKQWGRTFASAEEMRRFREDIRDRVEKWAEDFLEPDDDFLGTVDLGLNGGDDAALEAVLSEMARRVR